MSATVNLNDLLTDTTVVRGDLRTLRVTVLNDAGAITAPSAFVVQRLLPGETVADTVTATLVTTGVYDVPLDCSRFGVIQFRIVSTSPTNVTVGQLVVSKTPFD